MINTQLPDNLFHQQDINRVDGKLDNTLNKGEKAQQELIKAAICLFAEKGVEGTSTREITKLAGQNISSIAYYFESKEGLYLAVAETIVNYARQHFIPLVLRCEYYLASAKFDQTLLKELIIDILFTFLYVNTSKETINLSKIILAEQLNPTSAFKTIHENIFGRLQKLMLALFKTIPNLSLNDEFARLHIHSLIGSVAIFRFGQATIFKEIGWQEINQSNREKIQRVIKYQVTHLIDSLLINNSH